MSRTLRLVVAAVAVLELLTGCSTDGGGNDGANQVGGENEVVGEADEGIDGVKAIRVYYSSPVHTEADVDYQLRPPAGGMHNPVWANCGFYDAPIADEHVVHDLEHGAVWLAYSPDLPDADVEVIHDLVRANDKTIATPYPGLPAGAAMVVSAWARQLVLESVDDPRLEHFVIQYQDGSQAPEAGGYCTRSPIGEPMP